MWTRRTFKRSASGTPYSLVSSPMPAPRLKAANTVSDSDRVVADDEQPCEQFGPAYDIDCVPSLGICLGDRLNRLGELVGFETVGEQVDVLAGSVDQTMG